jgi:hypothetical protein
MDSLRTVHTCGVIIQNNAGALVANRLIYGSLEAAPDAAPPSANFWLRARLINFDTRNNVSNATGWLVYAIGSDEDKTLKSNVKATIS